MTDINIPRWFPLGKRSGEMGLGEMLQVAKRRVDFLFSYTDVEDANNIGHDPIIGNLSLCITSAVSDDAYFFHWLSETEADAFEYLLKKSPYTEQIAVMRFLYGDLIVGLSNVSSIINLDSDFIIRELSTVKRIKKTDMYQVASTFSEFNIIASKFEHAYKIIKRGVGFVVRGWVITFYVELLRTAKWVFQKRLEEKIRKIKKKIQKSMDKLEAYRVFAKEILSYWRGKRTALMPQKSSIVLFGKKVWQKSELFPPCSRLLFDQFLATGYIPHGDRLQLGLFLKALGMPVEEQLKFWYRAVDNVGLGWEEFMKKGGYYIRHIYGLEGSRKDYSAPKCDTIISKYFCPFARMDFSALKKALKKINPKITNEELEEIHNLCLLGDYKKACGIFLQSIIGKKTRPVVISHPVQYVRTLWKIMVRRRRKYEKEAQSLS